MVRYIRLGNVVRYELSMKLGMWLGMRLVGYEVMHIGMR